MLPLSQLDHYNYLTSVCLGSCLMRLLDIRLGSIVPVSETNANIHYLAKNPNQE